MRLAVLDTNVVVSAGIRPCSPPAHLVMDWVLEGQVQIATSRAIIEEYRDVTSRAKFNRFRFPPFWLEYLIEESIAMPDPAPWPYSGPDRADLPFLALAHSAGAWLVTGNLKHFPAKIRKGVVVVSPAVYLERLEAGGKTAL